MPFQARPSILENGDAKNFATRMAPKQRRHFDSSAGARLAKNAQKEKDVASLPEKGKKPKDSVHDQPLSPLLPDLFFVTSALRKIPESELPEEKTRK